MNHTSLGAAVSVKGKRCVMMRDVIAHQLPPTDDIVVLESFDGRIIYCALSELQRAREQHPKLPAYGFWQTLQYSGLVDKTRCLQVVYFDGDDGQYLYQNETVVFTGEIRGGKLVPAAGYTFDLDTVQPITYDVRKLRLPEKAAMSFEEREHHRSMGRLKLVMHFGAVAIFMASTFLVYEGRSLEYESDRQQALGMLTERVESLEARKLRLRQTRVEDLPDQRSVIESLLALAISIEKFSLPETPIKRSVFEVKTASLPAHLPPEIASKIDAVRHHRDGLLSLRWDFSR